MTREQFLRCVLGRSIANVDWTASDPDSLAAETITLDNGYRLSLSIEKDSIVPDFVAEFEASGRTILRSNGHLPTRPPHPIRSPLSEHPATRAPAK